MSLIQMGCEDVNWIEQSQYLVQLRISGGYPYASPVTD